jgi:2-polyprenyl-6-hydroxyphenyl methylase/3-demethylubiquinone-9 3-methyltransferase
MDQDDLKKIDSHFEFGENWLDYLRHVDEAAIAEAERGLLKLLPAEAVSGSRFLDIGCGSGLHALVAVRLGAAELVAIDIDPNSVKATTSLLNRESPATSQMVRELSVFDASPADLGTFDIVYSWGVLHHTGAMWEAVECAGRFVRPGGLFALALYQKRPTCGLWRAEKRLYTRAPSWVQDAIRGVYTAAYYAVLLVTGRNPSKYVREYKSLRGMNFHNDVHDWLGGYPYESATPREVSNRLRGMGFELVSQNVLGKGLGLLGTGCAEYTFRRTPAAAD